MQEARHRNICHQKPEKNGRKIETGEENPKCRTRWKANGIDGNKRQLTEDQLLFLRNGWRNTLGGLGLGLGRLWLQERPSLGHEAGLARRFVEDVIAIIRSVGRSIHYPN